MARPPYGDSPSGADKPTRKTSHKTQRRASSQQHRSLPTPLAPAELAEPDLIMLLGEPEVRLLMQADRVEEGELMQMLSAISVHIRNRTKNGEAADSSLPHGQDNDAEYRAGVGIVLINSRGEVFVGRRVDIDAWQMPQGGINRGESPRQAALRELEEEIGTDNVEIVAESEKWLYYDVPEKLARKAWQARWRGQRQKWFVMLFKGMDSDINIATSQPEFSAWRWSSVAELSALAVSFKRQLYLNVLGQFPTIFRD
jgi:putative (di)nucleoside polyphosphate hydrolase